MYRQGDVLLIPVEGDVSGGVPIEPDGDVYILARGEATGHHHAVTAVGTQLFTHPLMGMVLAVLRSPVVLTHQEHTNVEIPVGNYQVVRQREYSPQAIRRVSD